MKIENIEKLVANWHDKIQYIEHMRNLKQALNHRIFWGEVHRVIKFNENTWLKPCIDMNTDLRKKIKNYSEKDFFKLMNNAVYETTENVIKERDMRYKIFHNIK